MGFDNRRTNVTGGELTPGLVGSALTRVRFDTPLTSAQIYAQPVVFAGIVVVTAEDDQMIGVDEQSGAVLWRLSMGTPDRQIVSTCGDLSVQVGSTATPVIDPATGVVYATARDVSKGPAAWRIYAVDVRTGAVRPGWPQTIEGQASNNPAIRFDPTIHNQRPGLLLTGGQVFAGFASFCDAGPFLGWIAGVGAVGSGAPGAVHLWTDEADGSGSKGGFWQSGGALASDAPGQVLAVSANGTVPGVGPGNQPPQNLGNSVIRLAVQGDGSLRAVDFFASHDAPDRAKNDDDLGSGSAVLAPDGFGQIPGHPHLLITGGKDRRLYVLDRDNLGGRGTAPSSDGVVTPAPLPGQWFGHVATYNGDGGGWVYLNGGLAGGLRAYRLRGGALTLVASATAFNFGAGSPVVTSAGDGTALVWTLDTGTSELRAYRAPTGGTWDPVFRVGVGSVTKFSQVAVSDDRVFVATNAGHLLAVGPPRTAVSAVEGSDGAAYFRRAGSGFVGFGGRLAGAPAVVSLPVSGGQIPLLIVTGTDHRLWARTPQDAWYPFGAATDLCLDNPAATIAGSALLVGCHGLDGALWSSSTPAGPGLPRAGRFVSLGGRLLDGPALAAVGGLPTFLVNGTDGRVWSRPFDGSAGWQPHDWRCIGHPALATEAGGRTVFACHGTDNAVWVGSATNQLPIGASSLGGVAIDGVGLAAGPEGTLLSVEGGDAQLWNGWLTPAGAFTGWTTTGGVLRQGVGSAGGA